MQRAGTKVSQTGLPQQAASARVVHGEGHGVAKAVVHMRLRRKVHDGVNLLCLQHVHNQVRGLDVALDEPVRGAKGVRRGRVGARGQAAEQQQWQQPVAAADSCGEALVLP